MANAKAEKQRSHTTNTTANPPIIKDVPVDKKKYMRTKKEGHNTFSNYEAIKIYIDYSKLGKTTQSLQLTWGGYAHFDGGTLRNDIANYNIDIRRFFRSKVRDGYFTDRFIYVNDVPESIYERHSGLWFPKMFLFLEEEYEKKFVVEYLQTIFKSLSAYHHKHKNIIFTHYTARNGTENNKSISRPA